MYKHLDDRNNTILQNTTFIKTILMMLVIVCHAADFWTRKWFTQNPILPSNTLGLLANWLGSFHVYCFALVSGYLFAFKVMSGGYENYFTYIKDKAKRLLVPYVFVTIIWVAPISAYFFNWNFGYVVKKYLLAIDPSQLWFLWMLFGVFAIVWPIRKLLLRKKCVGWAMALVFYGIGLIGKRILPNVFCIWTACQYLLFFFLGVRIWAKEKRQEKLITDVLPWYCWVIADFFLLAGTMVVGQNSGALWSLLSSVFSLALHLVGAIMAWTTLQALANRVKWKDSNAFKTLSSYSMPIYLFHQQIIYFTIIGLNGKVNPWINAGVNFVVAIIGSYLISNILMRWNVTRFLIGEKHMQARTQHFDNSHMIER